jgi:hypothetical protein
MRERSTAAVTPISKPDDACSVGRGVRAETCSSGSEWRVVGHARLGGSGGEGRSTSGWLMKALKSRTSIEQRKFQAVNDLMPFGEEVEPLAVVVLVWEWEFVGDDPIAIQWLPML